jgi:TonB family protein
MRRFLVLLAVYLLTTPALSQQEPPLDEAESQSLIAQGIALPVVLPGQRCHPRFSRLHDRLTGGTAVTIIAFTIGADGAVKNMSVEQSSGSDDLDQMMRICAAKWRFTPATKAGQPVEVPWKARIVWKIGPQRTQ